MLWLTSIHVLQFLNIDKAQVDFIAHGRQESLILHRYGTCIDKIILQYSAFSARRNNIVIHSETPVGPHNIKIYII